MTKSCAKSCTACGGSVKKNFTLDDEDFIEPSSVDTMEPDALIAESAKFGEPQKAEGTTRLKTLNNVASTIEYMRSDEISNLSADLVESCLNRHELCSFWAVIGKSITQRCPPLEDAVPALEPGDLNKMFERIVATSPGNRTLTDEERQELADNNMTEYTVVIHSRPSEEPATESSTKTDKLPPWVVVFENFVTDEECETMIQLGYKHEYKRSADVGALKFDGTHESIQNSRRTSENAWCSFRHGCRNETVPARLHDRMSRVMNIPPEHSEDFQILKYEKGQFYRTHHVRFSALPCISDEQLSNIHPHLTIAQDYIGHQKDRQCGPRILTGGTNFPDLGITVEPKKGRALLWPSIYDSDPLKDDPRMRHQALPVKEGTKFAANGWIHLFNYVDAQKRGCH
eukprot:scaffold3410_cov141-Cylindrotheca_fusiformis.AAC.30